MQVQAKVSNLRIAPRKLGLVAGLVRGRSVADSLVILEHTPKHGAVMLAKLIKSAAANAEANHNLKAEQLKLATIDVGTGGMLKRWRPAAFGRAKPIRKRFTHVRVVVEADATTKPKRETDHGSKS